MVHDLFNGSYIFLLFFRSTAEVSNVAVALEKERK